MWIAYVMVNGLSTRSWVT